MTKIENLFKDFSLNEKLFLGSTVLIIFGLILPIVSIPLLGTFNALNSMGGAIFFFLVIGAIALFFWKREYSELAIFILSGLGLFQIIYTIVEMGGFTVDIGFLGEISLFTFLGIGFYVVILGFLSSFVLAILLIKEQKSAQKLFIVSIAILLVASLLSVFIGDNELGMQTSDGSEDSTDILESLVQIGTSSEEKKLETKSFSLGEKITFSGVELTFTTLEKAMHSKFTDYQKEVEYYRLTYTLKNTNTEKVTPCSFDFTFLDSNGHQIDDSSGVYNDGDSLYDEIFPNVEKTYREWFETNNEIEGDISIYISPEYVIDETCPKFEIKLEVPESEVSTPNKLTLLNEQTDNAKEETICPTISNTGNYDFEPGRETNYVRLYADFLTNAKFSDGWELSYKPTLNDIYDSFYCEKGNVEGENTNYVYCTTGLYTPTLKKNTIDETGNIANTDYLYIHSFIFDATGKDITNTNDLTTLSFKSITCSENYSY